MKILFTLTVIIAGVYLFIQQEGIDKLSQYLPQHQIDKSAETLLANVNKNVNEQVEKNVEEKFEQYKNTIISEKNEHIQILEKKLEALQTQFSAAQLSATQLSAAQLQPSSKIAEQERAEQEKTASLTFDQSTSDESAPNKATIQKLSSEPKLAKTQYLSGESSVYTDTSKHNTNKHNANKHSANKQKAIKRQANLQDIAARMNKTSLLALTH